MVGVGGGGAVAAISRWFQPRGPVPLADRDDGSIVFGRWGDREPCEDLVVVRRSATSLEVHPHGGLAASERVLADLVRSGCRRLGWQEWLAVRGLSVVELEVRTAMAIATAPKAAKILARQLAPHPDEPGRGLLEAAIEQVHRLTREGRQTEARNAIDRLVGWSRLGLRLARPWRVVVAGRPNAGKSSLVNALAGFSRSIVSAEPGTTRDLLETRIVLDGWEIDLVDTAGLREAAASPTEREGIARAIAASASADLVIWVVDATIDAADPAMDQPPPQAAAGILVLTKADLPAARPAPPAGAVATSATTGLGIDGLATRIVRRLVPREPAATEAVAFTTRQLDELARLRAALPCGAAS